jgi:hypothetical protein
MKAGGVGARIFRAGLWVSLAWVLFGLAPLHGEGFQEKPGSAAYPGAEYSGAYSFLRDGEFVQVTVEDGGRVTGFVSRYGDLESDKGAFLDHFFKSGRLDGERLTFATEVVHGIAFEFAGKIRRDAGRKPDEEGCYVIEGKLTETSSDDTGKRSSRERQVMLKSHPRKTEGASPPAAKD